MELIIDFYKSLDTLNLIIFWGIIIVIFLLLIFAFIMINKNKKLKKIVEEKNKYQEEIPIKKEEVTLSNEKEVSTKEAEILITKNEEDKEKLAENNNIVEEENKFIAEEHINTYHQDINLQHNNYQETKLKQETKQPIEMPTGPYQRNVLREMSLSQTSPIGINRQVRNEEKKLDMAKDLSNSLNNEQIDDYHTDKEENKINPVQNESKTLLDSQIKKELVNIEKTSPRKTEVINEYLTRDIDKKDEQKKSNEEIKKIYRTETKPEITKIDSTPNELLNIGSTTIEDKKEKSSSERYLEEVSKKLAEAEIPDEIERTNYELQQEEDAIISYKELMEKKDSIQTIDEEEAIISIEELMNKNNKKQEEIEKYQDAKLYNLAESEENDDFIKELKQFRNDL